ncbi:hypothetical protein BJ875DRAFT_16083 [Amylocarpus encephaloides]|uniref:Uncharacterized protein n=1 Tax=Amylocarpus encephaloides TaxID=45428 RepID=A0A9P8C5M8_9HELO|nr:hypothetical protein BJ875DRAFT_16083 [Amylocarpus encephaloides]
MNDEMDVDEPSESTTRCPKMTPGCESMKQDSKGIRNRDPKQGAPTRIDPRSRWNSPPKGRRRTNGPGLLLTTGNGNGNSNSNGNGNSSGNGNGNGNGHGHGHGNGIATAGSEAAWSRQQSRRLAVSASLEAYQPNQSLCSTGPGFTRSSAWYEEHVCMFACLHVCTRMLSGSVTRLQRQYHPEILPSGVFSKGLKRRSRPLTLTLTFTCSALTCTRTHSHSHPPSTALTSPALTNTHTYADSHTLTHTHTHSHTLTHTHTHSHTHTRSHTLTHTHTHSHP